MQNRFGFRDFVLILMLITLIVSVWLAMKSLDRYWARIDRIGEQLSQQAESQSRMLRELGEVHDKIEQGVKVAGSAAASGDAEAPDHAADPFEPIREARAEPDFAPGDWIIDAFGANVARITPFVSGDVYGSVIQERVLETLLVRDPDTLEWLPLVARTWSVSDDGLTITFRLRRGVTFSDGHPLTARDVVFTYELVNNEDINAPRARNYFDKVESVTAEGDYTVVFKFKEPYFQALGMAGGMEILPEHFYSQFSAEQINRKPGLLLGSGPYRMESPTDWAPGKTLRVVRNERYWGVPPAFDRMMFREINNDVARLTAFRNEEIDIFGAMPEQYVKMIEDDELMARCQNFVYERPTAGYGFIAWNQERGGKPTRFADKRVRQAMTMLTDRKRIDKEILLGFGIIPSGPFNRLSRQYDQDIEPLPYNEQKAKALLAEVGYRDRDGDGVLESESGEPFAFKYTYPASGGTGFWDRVSLFLKDSYARVGIVMKPDPLEWAVFRETLQSRDFDAISLAWAGGLETDVRQMFHSSQIGEGADNFISYANPKLDELIDEARRTVDEDTRMPMWKQVHRILHEDQPYTFLYSRKSLVFIDDRIKNVHRNRIGLNDRNEWYVPKPMQKY